MKKHVSKILGLIVILVIANIISSHAFLRQDFTHDQRYSLSGYSQDFSK